MALSARADLLLTGARDGLLQLWTLEDQAAPRTLGRPQASRALEAPLPQAQARLRKNQKATQPLLTLGAWLAFRGAWAAAIEVFEAARRGGAQPPGLLLGRCYAERGQARAALKAWEGQPASLEMGLRRQALQNLEERQGSRIGRSSEPAQRLLLAPDARLALSSSGQGDLSLWEVETGLPRGRLAGHRREVLALAFSHQGAHIASGSKGGSIRLWEVETLKERKLLRGHKGPVEALAFLPTGERLLSVSRDRTLRLWDLLEGTLLQTWEQDVPLSCLALSPDGLLALTGSRRADGTLTLWNLERGEAIRAWRGHEAALAHLTFGLQGERAFSADTKGLVKEWDLSSGEASSSFRAHEGEVLGIAPGGALFASRRWRDPALQVWDLRRGQRLRTWEDVPGVSALTFAADLSLILSAERGGDLVQRALPQGSR